MAPKHVEVFRTYLQFIILYLLVNVTDTALKFELASSGPLSWSPAVT